MARWRIQIEGNSDENLQQLAETRSPQRVIEECLQKLRTGGHTITVADFQKESDAGTTVNLLELPIVNGPDGDPPGPMPPHTA